MECWCGGTKDSLYYFYAAVISKGYSSPFNQGCKRDFERDEGSATNRISSCCCSPHKPIILLPNHKCELPLHFQLSIDTQSYTFYLSQVSIFLERGRLILIQSHSLTLRAKRASFTCRKMPQNIAKCREMPQNAAKCRKMPQNAA